MIKWTPFCLKYPSTRPFHIRQLEPHRLHTLGKRRRYELSTRRVVETIRRQDECCVSRRYTAWKARRPEAELDILQSRNIGLFDMAQSPAVVIIARYAALTTGLIFQTDT